MTLIVRDNFNRANENPLSNGGRWTAIGADGVTTGLKLVSNVAVRQGASGTFGRNGSYLSGLSFTAGYSCEVGATITTTGADGELELLLWNPGASHGFALLAAVGSFGAEIDLLRYDDASTSVVIDSNPYTMTANDQLVLQIDGDDIVGWLFRSGSWTEVLRATDTTYRLAFSPGAEIAGFNDTTSLAIDDFSANLLDVGPFNRPLRIPNRYVGPQALRQQFRQPPTNPQTGFYPAQDARYVQTRPANRYVGPQALRNKFFRADQRIWLPSSTVAVSSDVNGVATVAATVVRNRALTATANGVATVSASVVRTRTFTPAVAGVAAVSCSVVRTRTFSASSNGAAAVSAAVVRTRALSATANGAAAVSASLVATRVLPASVSGSASVTAALVRTRARSAEADGVATVSAAVVRSRVLVAEADGAAAVTAALVRTRALSAQANGAASVAASVVRDRALTVSVNGSAAVSATIVGARAVQAAVSGVATVSASLVRTRALDATVQGSAAVSATVGRTRPLAASVSAATAVAASVVRGRALAPTVNGTAAVSASIVFAGNTLLITAEADGSATVTAAVSKLRQFAAAAAGTATVTASLVRVRSLQPSSTGSASVGVEIVRTRALTASATGQSFAAVNLVRDRALAADATGTATVAVSLLSYKIGTATPQAEDGPTLVEALAASLTDAIATATGPNEAKKRRVVTKIATVTASGVYDSAVLAKPEN